MSSFPKTFFHPKKFERNNAVSMFGNKSRSLAFHFDKPGNHFPCSFLDRTPTAQSLNQGRKSFYENDKAASV